MDEPIAIREATEADLDVLVALNAEVQDLHARAFPARFKPADVNPDAVRAQFSEWLSEDDVCIVLALIGDLPIGYTILRVKETSDHSFCYAQRLLYVDHICVASAYRGKGIGSRLIEDARKRARDCGMGRIELDYWHFNEEAGAFFETQGFRPTRHYMAMTV